MSGECGTIILDSTGKIRGCGTAASQLFGGNYADMAGRPISALISDLEVGGAAQSYGARRLAYLSGDADWHRFMAVDLRGNGFAVELTIAQMRTQDGGEMFLLSLRRPQEV